MENSKNESGTRAHTERIIVASTVRNVQRHVSKLMRLIQNVTADYDVVGYVFFENDSTDGTVSELKKWVDILTVPVNITSLSFLEMKRTEVLAYGTNHVWNTIRQLNIATEYVFWVDFDEVNYGLAHLNTCMDLPPNWSACCANQYYVYYDLWALRSFDDWLPCDFWNTCGEDIRNTKWQRAKHIPADSLPIHVRSCFGGAVLYKYAHVQEHLDVAKYNGTTYAEERKGPFSRMKRVDGCEHVPFHDSLREQNSNFSLYIQPKFLNSGPGLWEHSQKDVAKNKPKWEASMMDPSMKKWYETRENSPLWTLKQ